MSKHILKVSAAAVLGAALSALANAPSLAYSTSPVSVTACDVIAPYATEFPFGGGMQQSATSDIALSFVNKRNVPATTVKFVLNNGRHTQTLLDRGTFSTGVQIEHTFAADTGTSARRNATCSVAEVEFADGSVWHSDASSIAKD